MIIHLTSIYFQERGRLLYKLADKMEQHAEELAQELAQLDSRLGDPGELSSWTTT
jgi:hypothetical protein